MENDYVLVEVWIPAATIKKDMYLPIRMPMQQIMNIFQRLLLEIGANMFQIQETTRFYRYDTLEELGVNATCYDYGIEHGETLLLL